MGNYKFSLAKIKYTLYTKYFPISFLLINIKYTFISNISKKVYGPYFVQCSDGSADKVKGLQGAWGTAALSLWLLS